jgi:FixJ family two-component response regulator
MKSCRTTTVLSFSEGLDPSPHWISGVDREGSGRGHPGIAEDQVGTISMLTTDVVMPEMNGRDPARRRLSFYPDHKRLFISGHTADVIAHQGALDEGVNFIRKPFSIQALAAKVREVPDQNRMNG